MLVVKTRLTLDLLLDAFYLKNSRLYLILYLLHLYLDRRLLFIGFRGFVEVGGQRGISGCQVLFGFRSQLACVFLHTIP